MVPCWWQITPCSTEAADPEAINFTYTNGFLTSVPGRVSSITYHANAMVNQMTHANGILETQAVDPNGMPRARSFLAQYLGNLRWASGVYQYDGSGGVVKIGDSVFLYDLGGRLNYGKVYDGPIGGGTPLTQSYSYDAFGNIQAISGDSGRNTPTSSATNRMTLGVSYDAAGNLTGWIANGYTYDAFNLMTRMVSGSEDWYYFYTADDERIWMHKPGGPNRSEWTLRGLNNRVLAIYAEHWGIWSLYRQFVYRDGGLLGARTGTGWTSMHVDHQGTTKFIGNSAGSQVGYHAYYGFGEELTGFAQNDERMKYTGHERDLASPLGPGDDLDYMHARHYNPLTGRFLSTDRAEGFANEPQSWNRYGYVINNPLNHVDPDGNAFRSPVLTQPHARRPAPALRINRPEPGDEEYCRPDREERRRPAPDLGIASLLFKYQTENRFGEWRECVYIACNPLNACGKLNTYEWVRGFQACPKGVSVSYLRTPVGCISLNHLHLGFSPC